MPETTFTKTITCGVKTNETHNYIYADFLSIFTQSFESLTFSFKIIQKVKTRHHPLFFNLCLLKIKDIQTYKEWQSTQISSEILDSYSLDIKDGIIIPSNIGINSPVWFRNSENSLFIFKNNLTRNNLELNTPQLPEECLKPNSTWLIYFNCNTNTKRSISNIISIQIKTNIIHPRIFPTITYTANVNLKNNDSKHTVLSYIYNITTEKNFKGFSTRIKPHILETPAFFTYIIFVTTIDCWDSNFTQKFVKQDLNNLETEQWIPVHPDQKQFIYKYDFIDNTNEHFFKLSPSAIKNNTHLIFAGCFDSDDYRPSGFCNIKILHSLFE